MDDPKLDEDLLDRANCGDKRAFAEFCQRALPSLLWYVKHHCRLLRVPESEALDICHAAILRGLIELERGTLKASKAWLKTVALNLVRDKGRRQRRVQIQLVERIDDRHTVPRPVSKHTEAYFDQLRDKVQRLNDDDRWLIEKVYVSQMTIKEAGEELGLSEDASHKRHQRALEKLRDLIEQHGTPLSKVR